jgi:hypothetical protein
MVQLVQCLSGMCKQFKVYLFHFHHFTNLIGNSKFTNCFSVLFSFNKIQSVPRNMTVREKFKMSSNIIC